MKIGKQARRDGKALFQSCVTNSALDEARVRQTVTQVIALKPRGYVAILQHFQRLVRLEVERRSATVESAVSLVPAVQAGVVANLTQRYGAGLNIQFLQNPALVGGLRVKVGSDVYDEIGRASCRERVCYAV